MTSATTMYHQEYGRCCCCCCYCGRRSFYNMNVSMFFFAFLYSHAFFWTLKIELIGLFSFCLFLFFGLFSVKQQQTPSTAYTKFSWKIYTPYKHSNNVLCLFYQIISWSDDSMVRATPFFCRCCLICLFRKKVFLSLTFSLFLRIFTLNVTIHECVDAMLQHNDLNSVIYTFDFRCCSWFFHQWNLTGFPMSNQTNFMFFSLSITDWIRF